MGRGWGEGIRSLDNLEDLPPPPPPPPPNPLPKGGEGAHRVRGPYVTATKLLPDGHAGSENPRRSRLAAGEVVQCAAGRARHQGADLGGRRGDPHLARRL